jgi:hypothetical protein
MFAIFREKTTSIINSFNDNAISTADAMQHQLIDHEEKARKQSRPDQEFT